MITTPFYHYTHGLKKHDGNCQRIAHGHRSKIDIYRNGKRCAASEQYWAERWSDIYIASSDDRMDANDLLMSYQPESSKYTCFAYEASQGWFEIVLPNSQCEIIETDSTVECLAQFIFEQEQTKQPCKSLKVVAYEGVGKGAMVGGNE